MVILQVCAYAAEYPGNFLNSLFALDKALLDKNHRTIYAFPENAKEKEWCKELSMHRHVYFLPLAKARLKWKTYLKLHQIILNENVDIIHSHFELYDLPVKIVTNMNQKVFWHLHDPITKTTLVRNLVDIIQYKYLSKNVKLLSVAEYYKQYVIKLGFNEKNAFTILNGIDLSRIDLTYKREQEYDFLTFGWDFYRKGSDIILNVCKRLDKAGYKFKFCLNGGDSTWENLNLYLQGDKPEWLILDYPQKDINKILAKAGCFIQASRRETFSYAIGEAAYFGLPVIVSDIEGVQWAKELPTTLFFENEDEDQLYYYMKSILDKKIQLSEQQLNRTREIIEKRYSVQCWVKNILKFYEI